MITLAGEYLDDSVERVPMIDHEGKSGALLERVTLADGRHLIVKRFSPRTDLLVAVLGDVVGREYVLWSRGILDLLPSEVGHAVVDGWGDDPGSPSSRVSASCSLNSGVPCR